MRSWAVAFLHRSVYCGQKNRSKRKARKLLTRSGPFFKRQRNRCPDNSPLPVAITAQQCPACCCYTSFYFNIPIVITIDRSNISGLVWMFPQRHGVWFYNRGSLKPDSRLRPTWTSSMKKILHTVEANFNNMLGAEVQDRPIGFRIVVGTLLVAALLLISISFLKLISWCQVV